MNASPLIRWAAFAAIATSLCNHVFSLSISDIWINEFHYDNVSTDEGEFIEVAGRAGLDLDANSVTVTLYNGSNGSVYNSFTLAGFLSDLGNGFGFATLELPRNGLQNGSPDGIALSYSGILLQFISYEGSLTATEGIAEGVTSTDIDVSESNDTPVGHSLQLQGSGSSYHDFKWSGASSETRGQINNNQKFGVPDTGIRASLAGLILLVLVVKRNDRSKAIGFD